MASGCIPGKVSSRGDSVEIIRDPRGGEGYLNDLASGTRSNLVATDALQLWESAGKPRTLDEVCPQRFLAPLAPPVAAKREGREIDTELLALGSTLWKDDFDWLIVEGAGGLLSPIADGLLNIDLYKRFQDAKLWIVSANRLGTIHQTLATCESAIARGCEISGVILNQVEPSTDDSVDQNEEQIRRYTDAPVIGSFQYQQQRWPDGWIPT